VGGPLRLVGWTLAPVTVDDSFENAEKVGLHLVGPHA